MRVFTEDEHALLRRIRDGQGRNLYSLIDPWINGVSFQVDRTTENVDFIFESRLDLRLIERLEEIQTIVIQAVNLIKLFEENGYIFTFINANQLPPNPFTFGQAAVNAPTIPYHFPDPRISKLFCQYSVMEIFVTPELDKFISDEFLTREEVRANRQWRTTRNALMIAIAALVLNIVFNIMNILAPFEIEKTTNLKNSEIKKEASSAIQTDTLIIYDTITLVKTTSTIISVNTDTLRHE